MEPNRIRETAGIELTSGRGEAIGIGGEPGRGPTGGRAALRGVARARGETAACCCCFVGWDGLARGCFAPCFFVFVFFFFFFGFLLRGFFFPAVESDLIAQECARRRGAEALLGVSEEGFRFLARVPAYVVSTLECALSLASTAPVII